MAELNDPNEPGHDEKVLAALDYLTQVQNAQLVMLMRLYDIELAALTRADGDYAEMISTAHSNGEFVATFPIIVPESD